MRDRWHILEAGDTLTVARRLPVRFDLRVAAGFPEAHRLRLAHQIRQDVWRALQRLRGFSPVVAVTRTATGLWVEAGGAIDGRVPGTAAPCLATLLGDPVHRARWLRYAAPRR